MVSRISPPISSIEVAWMVAISCRPKDLGTESNPLDKDAWRKLRSLSPGKAKVSSRSATFPGRTAAGDLASVGHDSFDQHSCQQHGVGREWRQHQIVYVNTTGSDEAQGSAQMEIVLSGVNFKLAANNLHHL